MVTSWKAKNWTFFHGTSNPPISGKVGMPSLVVSPTPCPRIGGKISRTPSSSWSFSCEENWFQLNPLMISNHILSTCLIYHNTQTKIKKNIVKCLGLYHLISMSPHIAIAVMGRCDSLQTQWSRTRSSLDHDLRNKSQIEIWIEIKQWLNVW